MTISLPGAVRLRPHGKDRFIEVGASASAAAFNPASISGLVGWWKADAGTSTTTDGVGVSQWTDQSAAGNNATQGTGSKQPLYKAAVQNGLPVLRFDATDDALVTVLSVLTPGITVFAVFRYNGALSSTRRLVVGSNNWLVGPYTGVVSAYGGAFAQGATMVGTGFACVSYTQVAGGTGILYRDGSQVATASMPTMPGTISFGAGGSASEPAESDVGEILIYNAVLSGANRGAVEAYLKGKWGTP